MSLHKSASSINIFFRLLTFLWVDNTNIRIRIVSSLILVFLSSAMLISLPWVMKWIIDLMSVRKDHSMLVLILAGYGLLWTISQICAQLRELISFRAFERGINKFSQKVFSSLLDLSINHHTQNSTGAVMNAIERAQFSIPNIFANFLFVFFPLAIEILISTAILAYNYNVIFSLILFAIPVLYTTYTYLTIGWLINAQRSENVQSSRVGAYVTDTLLNIEGIHYQCAQSLAMQECSERLQDREDAMTHQLERNTIVSIGQYLIAGTGFVVLTILSGKAVVHNQLILGDFILFNGYLLQFLVPLSALGMMFRQFREGLTKMEDVIRFIDQVPTKKTSETNSSRPIQGYSISFKNVAFDYPNENRTALKDISFHIPIGESLAIIGNNGSGKTTITRLLYRFYESYHGEILLGKRNIRNINVSLLRTIIGVVPQDVFILNRSLYGNLVFGSHDICKDDFDEVMKATNVDKIAKVLPESYDSILGERGLNLSGGQRQAIGIARVLLRKPKILIFDEATSALDIETEKKVFQYINKLIGITKLVITHNNRNLIYMDKTMLIENGSMHYYNQTENYSALNVN